MVKGFNSKEHAAGVLNPRVEELKLRERGTRTLFESARDEIVAMSADSPTHDVDRMARTLGAVGRSSESGLVAVFYPSRPMTGYEPETLEQTHSPMLFRRYELLPPDDEGSFIPAVGVPAEIQMRDVITDITEGEGRLELELSALQAREEFGIDIYAYEGFAQGRSVLDMDAA